MAKHKARRFDLYADEFLAAVSGEMTPSELGVYWMLNLLCYSRRSTLDYDLRWIRAKFRPHKGNQEIGPIIERLISSGRVVRDGEQIWIARAMQEVRRAQARIREAAKSGKRGGRPSNKNNGLEKGSGFQTEKLTTNYQPPTTNLEGTEASASVGGAPAPETPKERPVVKPRKTKPKTRLSPEWNPSLDDVRYARERGHDSRWVMEQADAYRDHHNAKQTLSGDWGASWRTWVRRTDEFAARRNGDIGARADGSAASRPGSIASAFGAVSALYDVE